MHLILGSKGEFYIYCLSSHLNPTKTIFRPTSGHWILSFIWKALNKRKQIAQFLRRRFAKFLAQMLLKRIGKFSVFLEYKLSFQNSANIFVDLNLPW